MFVSFSKMVLECFPWDTMWAVGIVYVRLMRLVCVIYLITTHEHVETSACIRVKHLKSGAIPGPHPARSSVSHAHKHTHTSNHILHMARSRQLSNCVTANAVNADSHPERDAPTKKLHTFRYISAEHPSKGKFLLFSVWIFFFNWRTRR